MANSKNTIQNIPLTGPLCLNTLKTDVTQFEGYNEKNSTVFGGELTPIRSKETTLGNKDSTYTIFNSKGEPFNFDLAHASVRDKNGTFLFNFSIPAELEDCAPADAYWYAFITGYKGDFIGQVYIDKTGKVWLRYTYSWNRAGSSPSFSYSSIAELLTKSYERLWSFNIDLTSDELLSVDAKVYYNDSDGDDDGINFVMSFHTQTKYYICGFNNAFTSRLNPWVYPSECWTLTGSLSNLTSSAFTVVSPVANSSNAFVSFVPFSGKKTVVGTEQATLLTITVSGHQITDARKEQVAYYYNSKGNQINLTERPVTPAQATTKTIEVYPEFAIMVCEDSSDRVNLNIMPGLQGTAVHSGHDGDYFIPGVKSNDFKDYYIDGSFYAATFLWRLIRQPGVLKLPFFYRVNDGINTTDSAVSFKDENEKWHTYFNINTATQQAFNTDLFRKSFEKFAILDKRYVPYVDGRKIGGLYDIEEKKFIKARLDYIDALIPYTLYVDPALPTTGVVYASGYNVNYPITNNPFIGHLMNPKVITDFPAKFNSTDPAYEYVKFWPNPNSERIEYFYSVGDNVQSAEYHGNNAEFDGTIYPIDSNGNIIYPITWESKIINGYSNNDLIKEGSTGYPLIYWNNNQKMYAYYLLSSMENIEGAFSLQGQQYTFDKDSIYNVQFSNGVIQNVNAVCYKKNMMFLGTLPTSAVFYSTFNKTFYRFTGDAILSKMFEASDIDEIKFVGQNPSSLSLWICTDKGVYVMSDTDMFKLDYDVTDIYFEESKAILVTEGTTNWIENDISLYDIGDDATETPIKLHTKFYGIGAEMKATYDCWYIRLHNKDHKAGKLKLKVNTITNTAFETEEKTYNIEPSMYDSNDTVFIRYQPQYQSAVATQLELESDIAIYQISLGVNATDAVAQQSKFNF